MLSRHVTKYMYLFSGRVVDMKTSKSKLTAKNVRKRGPKQNLSLLLTCNVQSSSGIATIDIKE